MTNQTEIEAIRERRSPEEIRKDWPVKPYAALTRGGTYARDDILDLLQALDESRAEVERLRENSEEEDRRRSERFRAANDLINAQDDRIKVLEEQVSNVVKIIGTATRVPIVGEVG